MDASRSFRSRIRRDVVIIAISVAVAIVLARTGFLSQFFLVNTESVLIGSFVAGVLFTSLFTTPIAIATFVSIAPGISVWVMAIVGALGAVLGDLALFGLVRFTFQADVQHLMALPKYRRFFHVFHRRMFRWLLPFLGALIIASPLPDELGIGLLGVSRMSIRTLMCISFVMNAIGIALVGFATHG